MKTTFHQLFARTLVFALPVVAFACTITMHKANAQNFPEIAIPYQPETYVCHYADTPLNVDGHMKEQAWKQAPWSNKFVDIEGRDQPKPAYDTRIKMLWDSSAFYIFVRMEEPHIWATIKERDAVIFRENDFEVFIDPDGDTHHYAELEINALNTVWDLMLTKPYRDGGNALTNWNMPNLRTAVALEGTLNDPSDKDRYWTCEIAFSWNDLKTVASRRLPPAPDSHWYVNFSRVQWQIKDENGRYVKRKDADGKELPEMNWVWSPQGRINMHRPERWGLVQFTPEKPGADVDFKHPPANRIRWYLRNLYYRQHAYFAEHKRYAQTLQALEPGSLPAVKGLKSTTLHAGPHWYVITVKMDKDARWAIREDGKVWKLQP